MAIEVHAEPLQKRYYAPICSSTCCYMIIYGFVIILLPLIIAYNSYGKETQWSATEYMTYDI